MANDNAKLLTRAEELKSKITAQNQKLQVNLHRIGLDKMCSEQELLEILAQCEDDIAQAERELLDATTQLESMLDDLEMRIKAVETRN